MYDDERLTSAISRAGFASPAAIVERLVDELDVFADGQESLDDETLLVIGIGAAS
jgi:serine phosphatase RsbU (regulator of sigma subunit)